VTSYGKILKLSLARASGSLHGRWIVTLGCCSLLRVRLIQHQGDHYLILQSRHSLFWHCRHLYTPLLLISKWLVIQSHVHAKIRLCGATALKMPLRPHLPTCAARFTALKAITGTGECKTAYLDGQGRVASGRSVLRARIKGLLFLPLLKYIHAPTPVSIIVISYRTALQLSRLRDITRSHGRPRRQRSMMSGYHFWVQVRNMNVLLFPPKNCATQGSHHRCSH
jgi:hypothetical protein